MRCKLCGATINEMGYCPSCGYIPKNTIEISITDEPVRQDGSRLSQNYDSNDQDNE